MDREKLLYEKKNKVNNFVNSRAKVLKKFKHKHQIKKKAKYLHPQYTKQKEFLIKFFRFLQFLNFESELNFN